MNRILKEKNTFLNILYKFGRKTKKKTLEKRPRLR